MDFLDNNPVSAGDEVHVINFETKDRFGYRRVIEFFYIVKPYKESNLGGWSYGPVYCNIFVNKTQRPIRFDPVGFYNEYETEENDSAPNLINYDNVKGF